MFLKIRNKFYWGYRGFAPISKQSPLPVWEGGMGDGVVNFAKCKIKNSYAVILACKYNAYRFFISFLFERKKKRNEAKKRKTEPQRGQDCQGQAPEPPCLQMSAFCFFFAFCIKNIIGHNLYQSLNISFFNNLTKTYFDWYTPCYPNQIL